MFGSVKNMTMININCKWPFNTVVHLPSSEMSFAVTTLAILMLWHLAKWPNDVVNKLATC